MRFLILIEACFGFAVGSGIGLLSRLCPWLNGIGMH